MLINGNLVGLAMVVLSALIVALPGYLFKLPNAPVMMGVGAVLRVAKRSDAKWLMGPRTGGYLFFIPVWIFGIAVVIINLINALIVKK